jgi:hypothetical protein
MQNLIILAIVIIAAVLVIRHFVKGKCGCISKSDAEKMNDGSSSCCSKCGCGSSENSTSDKS